MPDKPKASRKKTKQDASPSKSAKKAGLSTVSHTAHDVLSEVEEVEESAVPEQVSEILPTSQSSYLCLLKFWHQSNFEFLNLSLVPNHQN